MGGEALVGLRAFVPMLIGLGGAALVLIRTDFFVPGGSVVMPSQKAPHHGGQLEQ